MKCCQPGMSSFYPILAPKAIPTRLLAILRAIVVHSLPAPTRRASQATFSPRFYAVMSQDNFPGPQTDQESFALVVR